MKTLINRRLGAIKKHMTCANFVKAGLFGLLAFGMIHTSYAADDTDPLKSVGTSVSHAFGSGSTFMWILMIAEVVAGVIAYIKTKNMMVLIGIVIVFMFTAAAFTLIGAAPGG